MHKKAIKVIARIFAEIATYFARYYFETIISYWENSIFRRYNFTDNLISKAMKVKLPIWRNAYLIVVFTAVVLWVFVGFPLVNLSSGEIKPRGLFVDENAINLHASINTLIPPYSKISNANLSNDLMTCECKDCVCAENRIGGPPCNAIQPTLSSTPSLNCFDFIESHGHLQQITIDPRWNPKPLESTLLVFTLQPEPVSHKQVHSLLENIVFAFSNAKWQAKRVIILLTYAHTNAHREQLLDRWIRDKYASLSSEKSAHMGMIRHAYIVDYTHTQAVLSSTKPMKFSQIWCRYMSKYGMLPNMDMIAYLLLKFKGLVSIPYVLPSITSPPYPPAYSLTSSLLQYVHSFINDVMASFKNPHFNVYLQRVYALVWSMCEQVFGHFDGSGDINSQFLAFNIDTIVLQPVYNSYNAKSNIYGIEDVYEVIMQALHMSNNLEEELHHSIFYYLLLDNNTFVGITEYGLPLGLGLVSFIVMFAIFGNKLSSVYSTFNIAIAAYFGGVSILFACLASISFSHALMFYVAVFPLSYTILAYAAN